MTHRGESCHLAQPHFDANAGSACHVHERIEREEVDLAVHQVRDSRLGYAEEPGRLGLAELGASNVFLQAHHERLAQLHVLRLLGSFLDGIPNTVKALAGHDRNSLTNSRHRRAANSMSDSRVRWLSFFLEAVQYVEGGGEFSNIHHSERTARIRDADLPHAGADGAHGLPILRLESALDPIELKTRFPPRSLRKITQILACAPAELDGLAFHR